MAKDLRYFLARVQDQLPGGIKSVNTVMDHRFEISAVIEKLEQDNQWPLVIFNRVLNQKGGLCQFKVAANIFATRQKCAIALELPPDHWRMEPSLKFAKLSKNRIKPEVIDSRDAPVKEVVKTGDAVDLYELPVLTHHEMDGFPYLVDAVIAADPETGCYNSSHHRQMVRHKDELGIWMSPRHLRNYWTRAAKKGEPLPVAHVVGHHPGFYLGTEALVDIDDDEYEVIGAVLD
ncbi:MAG: UbiD family decarboxylase, partial [Firmicutes bacterium]|nr:UbiD family decarboxylase [Bacillota bacterium]